MFEFRLSFKADNKQLLLAIIMRFKRNGSFVDGVTVVPVVFALNEKDDGNKYRFWLWKTKTRIKIMGSLVSAVLCIVLSRRVLDPVE